MSGFTLWQKVRELYTVYIYIYIFLSSLRGFCTWLYSKYSYLVQMIFKQVYLSHEKDSNNHYHSGS